MMPYSTSRCVHPALGPIRALASMAVVLMLVPPVRSAAPPWEAIGTTRGLVVTLGAQADEVALRVAQASDLTVYVQAGSEAEVEQFRQRVDTAGLLGSRIYIQQGKRRIHLADNLADAVIVTDQSNNGRAFDRDELVRVLRPGGRLIVGDEISSKAVPDGMGEWSHPYHGPDNNPQSEDRIAKAPYLTHFLAKPYYGPMPEVTVTSGGRLFKAFGHIAFKEREWPMLGKLVAMNAYNGAQLWQRDLTPGFMIHRNTIVATPDTLYLADNESCKLIDAASGQLRDQIVFPDDAAEGGGWKWLALSDGVLYALLGPPDVIDDVLRGNAKHAGWPWDGLGRNYAKLSEDYPWGFGRRLLAIDPTTKRIMWSRMEEEPIDGRAIAMCGQRIFLYAHQKYLLSVDAKTGQTLWKSSRPELLEAIGSHDPAQTYLKGYASQVYLKASQRALYFAGPQRTKLVAVSTDDGTILWQHGDGNMQLVLRDDAVYAMGKLSASMKLDPLTGEVLAELPCLRGNCTRATGTFDSIFARGDQHTGTLQVSVADDTPRRIPAMRPACQDGVIAAGGLLYWGPWMCDCNHTLIGVISLAPAGDFDFTQRASERERLEAAVDNPADVLPLSLTEADWPTYRKNNQRTAETPVSVAEPMKLAWEYLSPSPVVPTAPITVDGLTFVSGSDGIVHAFENESGRERWRAYTGGRVHYPPAYWNGRLYAGSADGWVYAWEAATGHRLWRFRAAPLERMIPLYGELSSTWPVASGAIVQDGVVYAAAGIVSHDGTHVYALDAVTGSIRWQNNTSGQLMGEDIVCGVSVQGHMLLHDHKLYLAGGNVVSPAIYDAETGACLNTLVDQWQKGPRGSELFLIGDEVRVFDRMLYGVREYIPSRYYAKYLLHAGGTSDVAYQGTETEMMCVQLRGGADDKAKLVWKQGGFVETAGVTVTKNAILALVQVADQSDKEPESMLVMLDANDGRIRFRQPLPTLATAWGLAVDRDGRILVTTVDGRVQCYASN